MRPSARRVQESLLRRESYTRSSIPTLLLAVCISEFV